MSVSIYTFQPERDRITIGAEISTGSLKSVRNCRVYLHTRDLSINAVDIIRNTKPSLSRQHQHQQQWRSEIEKIEWINLLFPNSIYFTQCLAQRVFNGEIQGLIFERADCDMDFLIFDHGFVNPVTKQAYDSRGRLKLAECIAQGLSLLHGQNITHGDFSLPNLLVFGETVKITDLLTIELANTLKSRVIKGAPMFMPPEMILKFAEGEASMPSDYPTAARDLWAEGVVLMYLLENFKPDWHDTVNKGWRKISDRKALYRMMMATTYPNRFGLMHLKPEDRTPAVDVVMQFKNDPLLKTRSS